MATKTLSAVQAELYAKEQEEKLNKAADLLERFLSAREDISDTVDNIIQSGTEVEKQRQDLIRRENALAKEAEDLKKTMPEAFFLYSRRFKEYARREDYTGFNEFLLQSGYFRQWSFGNRFIQGR